MNTFESRTYSISDVLEWDRNQQLVLNPRFQRRSVWSDSAKSYLMDSIIRGRPIPKIFIRQKLNTVKQTSIKEVVDGQQRLKTILTYLRDGFTIMKKHNAEYGGKFFSQLDEPTQAQVLNYDLSVDLLINVSDEEVLDIFGRLNSYAYNLNEQEKINSNHFGPFKTLADKIGHKYYRFWTQSGLISDAQILRMSDVTLVADLLIAMIEGIKSKKQIKSFYDQYEKEFSCDVEVLEQQFDSVMQLISAILGNSISTSEFRRVHIFYTLFTALYHLQYGLKNLKVSRRPLSPSDYSRAQNVLENIETVFQVEDIQTLSKDEVTFLQDSRRATTDAAVRIRRTEFIVTRILGE